ncbi:hypothetical protein, partial [Viscerimonas tarda]
MKKLFLLLAVFACLTVEAQEFLAQPPENALPSEVAAQNITELTSRPELRAKPTDIDGSEHAQKVMIGDLESKHWMALVLLLFGYACFR